MHPSIRNLTIHDISAQARAAVDLGIPHEEANHFDKNSDFERPLHAAFKGAYDAYAKTQAVAA